MRRARLVVDEQRLELGGEVCVFLNDGFRVHVVSDGGYYAFKVVGDRGEVWLAASSLQGRDQWMSRLEALASCRRVESTRVACWQRIDARRSAHADCVFGSYLYKKCGWGWSRRYFLLLAERHELLLYKKALTEAQRSELAEGGQAPLECTVFSLQNAIVSSKAASPRFRIKNTNFKATLDARASDLASVWIHKLTDAIARANERQCTELVFMPSPERVEWSSTQSRAREKEEFPSSANQGEAESLKTNKNSHPAASPRTPRQTSLINETEISLTILSAGGTIICVTIPQSANFSRLKQIIHNQHHDFPPHRIKLLLQGKSVGDIDEASLCDRNVTSGSNLFLVLRR